MNKLDCFCTFSASQWPTKTLTSDLTTCGAKIALKTAELQGSPPNWSTVSLPILLANLSISNLEKSLSKKKS